MRAALIACVLVAVLAPRAHAGRGASSLKFLADDSKAVVLIDVAKGRKSTVFQKSFELAADKAPQLSIIKLDKVDTVIGGFTSDKNVVLVLEGKVDPLLAELKKKSTANATHNKVTYWTTPDAEVALIDKKLVIATTGTMPAVIDRAADKKRAKGPARARSLIAAGQTGASIVLATVPDAQMAKDLAKQLGSAPTQLVVSLSPATNLTIDARVAFRDETSAETARKALDTLLSADTKDRLEAFVGKEFADSVQIDRDAATVRGSAVMTADEVDKVLGMARMFM